MYRRWMGAWVAGWSGDEVDPKWPRQVTSDTLPLRLKYYQHIALSVTDVHGSVRMRVCACGISLDAGIFYVKWSVHSYVCLRLCVRTRVRACMCLDVRVSLLYVNQHANIKACVYLYAHECAYLYLHITLQGCTSVTKNKYVINIPLHSSYPDRFYSRLDPERRPNRKYPIPERRRSR